MKDNHRKINLYTPVQRWTARVLFIVGMFGSCSPQSALAVFPGPAKMVQYFAAGVSLLGLGSPLQVLSGETGICLNGLCSDKDGAMVSSHAGYTRNLLQEPLSLEELAGSLSLAETLAQTLGLCNKFVNDRNSKAYFIAAVSGHNHTATFISFLYNFKVFPIGGYQEGHEEAANGMIACLKKLESYQDSDKRHYVVTKIELLHGKYHELPSFEIFSELGELSVYGSDLEELPALPASLTVLSIERTPLCCSCLVGEGLESCPKDTLVSASYEVKCHELFCF